jgi:hypothetical protein
MLLIQEKKTDDNLYFDLILDSNNKNLINYPSHHYQEHIYVDLSSIPPDCPSLFQCNHMIHTKSHMMQYLKYQINVVYQLFLWTFIQSLTMPESLNSLSRSFILLLKKNIKSECLIKKNTVFWLVDFGDRVWTQKWVNS